MKIKNLVLGTIFLGAFFSKSFTSNLPAQVRADHLMPSFVKNSDTHFDVCGLSAVCLSLSSVATITAAGLIVFSSSPTCCVGCSVVAGISGSSACCSSLMAMRHYTLAQVAQEREDYEKALRMQNLRRANNHLLVHFPVQQSMGMVSIPQSNML